ncbi:MAG TPA: peptidylprolyl isomerase, partial [Burkholderiaceae bacterium]|nr:peptidylprolyl isomerase [Burkholderiaceae bacterium]
MTTTTTPLRSRLRRIAAACALLTALGSPTATWAAPTTTSTLIKIDQFGYLPTMRKVAILADPQVGWNAAEAYTPGTGSGQIQVRRWAEDNWPAATRSWGPAFPLRTNRSLEDYRQIVRSYLIGQLPNRYPKVKVEIEQLGTMELELFGPEAPLTVANFLTLVDRHYFDGLRF